MKRSLLTLIAIILTINMIIAQSFIDTRDGNFYQTVTIGNQIWMAENLKYLPEVTGSLMGSNNDIYKYYYVYGYEGTDTAAAKLTSNYNTYGVLYNFAAATNGEGYSYQNEPEQGVCPTGWHLPTDAEWEELRNFIGGIPYGGKLKSTGDSWSPPNTAATNETGFSALPAGYRVPSPVNFSGVGEFGYWWSSSYIQGVGSDYANAVILFHNDSIFHKTFYDKSSGFSVRCIKTICDLNLNIDTLNDEWISHNPGATFQWLYSDDGISFSNIFDWDSVFTPSQTGFYAVEITDGLCKDTSNIYFYENNSVIVKNTNDNQIIIYPNPTIKYLNIDFKEFQQNINICITDYNGRIIKIYYYKNATNIKIDISSLKSGVYDLSIRINGNYFNANFVKE